MVSGRQIVMLRGRRRGWRHKASLQWTWALNWGPGWIHRSIAPGLPCLATSPSLMSFTQCVYTSSTEFLKRFSTCMHHSQLQGQNGVGGWQWVCGQFSFKDFSTPQLSSRNTYGEWDGELYRNKAKIILIQKKVSVETNVFKNWIGQILKRFRTSFLKTCHFVI